jgi:hypothetical protein
LERLERAATSLLGSKRFSPSKRYEVKTKAAFLLLSRTAVSIHLFAKAAPSCLSNGSVSARARRRSPTSMNIEVEVVERLFFPLGLCQETGDAEVEIGFLQNQRAKLGAKCCVNFAYKKTSALSQTFQALRGMLGA